MTTASGKVFPLRVRLRRQTAIVSRWLHIYLSMASFAVILFFAATGLTLNHPNWFQGQQRTVVRHGVADASLIKGEVDKLRLVEMLRAKEHLRGAVGDVTVDDQQVQLSARAPGYSADVFVDRATGKYDLTEVSSGLVAVMNDLHRGHDVGAAWGWVIDVSAVMLALVSLTGLVLIWFVYKRRVAGLVLAGIAAVVLVGVYRWLVP